jgi:hypothetical protein
MKTRSIVVTVSLLAVMPFAALAQPASKARTHVDIEPPRLEKILSNTTSQSNGELTSAVATKPEIPLGPLDALKEYENEMTVVAQRMSADMANISQAQQANQITREQAEYLIQERYQVAMMQFQTLSALHDALGRDVAQAAAVAKHPDTAAESDAAVAVEPPFSPVRTQ